MTALGRLPFVVLVACLFTSAALAAPKGTSDPVASCVSNAATQFNLDYALCHGMYPLEATQLRGQCEAQAMVKYTVAVAACGNGKASSVRTGVSPSLKQNTDSGFLRRLRF